MFHVDRGSLWGRALAMVAGTPAQLCDRQRFTPLSCALATVKIVNFLLYIFYNLKSSLKSKKKI